MNEHKERARKILAKILARPSPEHQPEYGIDLIAAALAEERERCAKIADVEAVNWHKQMVARTRSAETIAEKIRSGETP